MHVLQILPALNEGGVERGTVDFNREIVHRGHRSTIISAGGQLVSQIEQAGGQHLTMDVASKNPLSAPRRVRRLRQLIQKCNPDIIHVRSRVPAWLAHYANRPARPLVSTVHGFNSINAYSRIMTCADLVICGSQAVIAHIQKAYKVPPEIIRLVHRGFDPTAFNPAHLDHNFIEDFQKRHHLDGHFVFLAVGRITAWKGYREIITALALARAQLPPFKLLIVGGIQKGQEEYAAELQQLVAQHHLSNQIIFTGSQSKVPEIYHCANIVISNTTSKPETFGRTMVEALAMERPVIASAQGGALDIIRPGQNGWLIPPGDQAALVHALIAAIEHPFSGIRADVLQRFSLELMVNKTLAVYVEVLSSRPRT